MPPSQLLTARDEVLANRSHPLETQEEDKVREVEEVQSSLHLNNPRELPDQLDQNQLHLPEDKLQHLLQLQSAVVESSKSNLIVELNRPLLTKTMIATVQTMTTIATSIVTMIAITMTTIMVIITMMRTMMIMVIKAGESSTIHISTSSI